MSLELVMLHASQRVASLVCINIEAFRDIFRYVDAKKFCAVLRIENPWQDSSIINLLEQLSKVTSIKNFYSYMCADTKEFHQYLSTLLAKNQSLKLAFESVYVNLAQKIEDFYKNQPCVARKRKLKLEYLSEKLLQVLDTYGNHLAEESEWQAPRSEISAYSKKILEKKWQALECLKSTLLNPPDPDRLIFKKLCRFLQEFPTHHENLRKHIDSEDTLITTIIANLVHLNIEVFKDVFRHPDSENFCTVLRIKNLWQHSSYIIDFFEQVSTLINVNEFYNSVCSNPVDACKRLVENKKLALAFAPICIKFTQEIESFYKYQPIEMQQERNSKSKNLEHLLEKLLRVLDNYGDHLAEESEQQACSEIKEKWQALARLKSTLLDYPDPQDTLIFKKLCRFSQELTEHHEDLRTHRDSVGVRIIKIIAEFFINITSCFMFCFTKYKQQKSPYFWRSQGASTTNKLSSIFKEVGNTDTIAQLAPCNVIH